MNTFISVDWVSESGKPGDIILFQSCSYFPKFDQLNKLHQQF